MLPTVNEPCSTQSRRVSGESLCIGTFLPQRNTHRISTPVDLMEVFHSLDDDTLRRVLNMGLLLITVVFSCVLYLESFLAGRGYRTI